MSKKLAKVNITSLFRDWQETDYNSIFVNPNLVQVLNAVVDEGKLYLIYTYDDEDFSEVGPTKQ